jgi:peptidoglycan/LPS O-acetylase OafA/YrhL
MTATRQSAGREPGTKALAYMPGLDGIRAFAIGAVLLFHGGATWLPGGFLGVDVFFALSGFLITGILLKEFGKTGRLDVGRFYLSRIRRLAPAFFTMLFVTATYATLCVPDSVVSSWRDLPSAASGLSNWWFVFNQQDYFQAFGRPRLFEHTWSLAAETQFYAFWPLVLLAILPRFRVLGARWLALVCAAASAGVMLWLGRDLAAASSVSVSHMYFGTDTHSMALFLGAALATCWVPLAAAGRPKGVSLALDAAGLFALAGLGLLMHCMNRATGTLFPLGFPIAAALAVLLILPASSPGLLVSRVLTLAPLRWIGERSYGLYLWHWPIFQVTRPGLDVRLPVLADLALRVVLTVTIAEISYRFIEMPVRRGAIGRLWARTRTWSPLRLRAAAMGLIVAIALVAGTEAVLATRAIGADASARNALALGPAISTPAPSVRHGALTTWRRPDRGLGSGGVTSLPALLLGDSIMLGASPWIGRRLNVAESDAAVSRQAPAILERARELAASRVFPVVVLNLGNNGDFDEATLRGILSAFSTSTYVVMVNAKVPRPWQDGNDVMLARVVPQFPNAILADWRSASEDRPDLFGSDGVHPNGGGAELYASVIVRALETKASEVALRAAAHAAKSVASGPKIFVLDVGSGPANAAIDEFGSDARGNVAPLARIQGRHTGLSGARGLVVDASGELLVVDGRAAKILGFAPATASDSTPNLRISGPALAGAVGLALGPSGDIFVATHCAFNCRAKNRDRVVQLRKRRDGSFDVRADIAGPDTGLSDVRAVAVDERGHIYVTNGLGDSVVAFAPHADGNAKPLAVIALPQDFARPDVSSVAAGRSELVVRVSPANLVLYQRDEHGTAPQPGETLAVTSDDIFMSPAGTLVAANAGARSVSEYATLPGGEVKTLRTVAGPRTRLIEPLAVYVR